MQIIKHATNSQILSSLLVYCPYCNFNLNNVPENIGKLMTHVRGEHLKYPFPIPKSDSEKIHKGELFYETEKQKEPHFFVEDDIIAQNDLKKAKEEKSNEA